MQRGYRAVVCVGVLGWSVLAMGGCLISSARSERVSGQMVSLSDVRAVKAGETSESALLDLLGMPSESITESDGARRYFWRGSRTESSAGSVFLIFGGASKKVTEQTVTAVCRDGVVQSIVLK